MTLGNVVEGQDVYDGETSANRTPPMLDIAQLLLMIC